MGADIKSVAGTHFEVTREYNAPREQVFKAFIERERLMRWWGPQGFTMKTARCSAKQGGVFHGTAHHRHFQGRTD
jgi:uncharacterized protein YndB with AHSA1/START domain